MHFLDALIVWFRRFAARRRARALLAQNLPRGVTTPALLPALRTPTDPAAGEYATLPLGAEVVRGTPPRRLLRLAALPPPPQEFSAVRPDRLRLDHDLRLPPERDAARTAADLPPPAPPRVPPRPREPLARAPLSRVDPRAFRLDARDFSPANEERVAVERVWLHPVLRRAVVEPRRMASRSTFGTAPFPAEWFASWWLQHKAARRGAGNPKSRRQPPRIAESMQEVKEQMLIRRDVIKDEAPPAPARYKPNEAPRAIASHAPPAIASLIPPTTWTGGPLPWPEPPPQSLQSTDAYFEWRTLIDALGDG